jgi:hypothetical protein
MPLFRGRAAMASAYFYLRCLLCSTEVGQVLDGRFRQYRDCTIPIPQRGGTPRCYHCGGSLYLEPIDQAELSVLGLEIAREVAGQADR